MITNAIIELSHLSLIKVLGAKADQFLQGQLTCDIRQINANQSLLGAHCNAKGRVLLSLRVLHFQDNFHLLLPQKMVDAAISRLKQYARLSRVQIEKVTELEAIGCIGTEVESTLKKFSELPSGPDQATSKEGYSTLRMRGSQSRFILLGTKDSLHTPLEALSQNYPLLTANNWQLAEILAGIPTIYPETMDKFTPHMLNYPALNAVSFKKGCYIGQEVIARTEYLGKVKRRLHRAYLTSETLPQSGESLLNANQLEVGIILEAEYSEDKTCQVLAVLQNGALENEIFWQGKKVLSEI